MNFKKIIIFILIVVITIGTINIIIYNFLPQEDINSFNRFKHIAFFNINPLHYKYIIKYNLDIKEKYYSGGCKIYYCENRKNKDRCFFIILRNCEDHFLVYEKEGLSLDFILEELDNSDELKKLVQKNPKFSYFVSCNVKYINLYACFKLPGYINNIEKHVYDIADNIRWDLSYFFTDDSLIIEFKSGKVYYRDSYKETYLFTIPKK